MSGFLVWYIIYGCLRQGALIDQVMVGIDVLRFVNMVAVPEFTDFIVLGGLFFLFCMTFVYLVKCWLWWVVSWPFEEVLVPYTLPDKMREFRAELDAFSAFLELF